MNIPTRLPDRRARFAVAEETNCAELESRVAATDDDFYRNPLWLVVVASACLFVALTILTVFG
jgi:hypothetical protein